ncbi:exosome complex component rrp45 isoform X1 [Drosophila subobscura]|uniref:exosome complex component rrp45 isoform X1 n=1 Tax=Drosophila subobscura TaxID=7241 RepID=UPI00155AA1F0|nr:exosome complex component rrp45 isoform X1 [Drosophila subobscura]
MFMNTGLFEPGKTKTERKFIQQAVKQSQRLDGRKSGESRNVEITFGGEYGSVIVSLGETKVMAQVTCDMGTPTTSRPNEGKLQLFVTLAGVSYLDSVQKTHDKRSLTLNSLLERTFRTSRCVDLESLCVASELHVWCIRVDVNVLNHDGNLYDASTIAVLAALMHFRRPDVTFTDGELRTYTEKERDMIPLLFLHYPVSVTYCIYTSNFQPFVDPTLLEENCADSTIILSFNSYQELCTLNAGGTVPTDVRTIMQCARSAANRCKAMVTFVRKALDLDEQQRLQGSTRKYTGMLGLMAKSSQKLSFRTLMKGEQKQEQQQQHKSEDMEIEAEARPSAKLEECVAENVENDQPAQEEDLRMDASGWLPQEAEPEHIIDLTKQGPGKPKRKRNKGNKKKQPQSS